MMTRCRSLGLGMGSFELTHRDCCWGIGRQVGRSKYGYLDYIVLLGTDWRGLCHFALTFVIPRPFTWLGIGVSTGSIYSHALTIALKEMKQHMTFESCHCVVDERCCT